MPLNGGPDRRQPPASSCRDRIRWPQRAARNFSLSEFRNRMRLPISRSLPRSFGA